MNRTSAENSSFAVLYLHPYSAAWQTQVTSASSGERLVHRHLLLKTRLDWDLCGATLGEDEHVMEASIDLQCVSPPYPDDGLERANRCSVYEKEPESHWA